MAFKLRSPPLGSWVPRKYVMALFATMIKRLFGPMKGVRCICIASNLGRWCSS